MALGGGIFVNQNKILPGCYINFVSASRGSSALSQRGYAAMSLEMDWGEDGRVFVVDAADIQNNSLESLKLFGYNYEHDKLKGLRDLFLNTRTAYFYRLNSGERASNIYAEARCSGIRGNDITIVIENNEDSTPESPVYDVSTYFESFCVDKQTVKNSAELLDNDFVEFKSSSTLELTAGTPLTGGSNGSVTDAAYQTFLDKIESYSFNALGCPSNSVTVKSLFANFTKRMRDEVGAKFQCVLHRHEQADYEGVISIENSVGGVQDDASAVYWVTGVTAGQEINRSNTNRLYDGEFDIDADYTQSQLEQALLSGKFIFHRTGDQIRVLEDINTYTTFTQEKNEDFKSNQTVRIIDQIANDIALLFNTKYNGSIPNDAAGRISLWNDIVKHHQELETIRAIEGFSPDAVTVERGDSKRSVVVRDLITPVSAMTQMYMTVVVN